MKIAKTLRAIADMLDEPVDSQKDESHPQKQLIFYHVVLEKQFSLRFTINTTLISISTACLALLPTVTERLFTKGIPCVLKPLLFEALVCFVLLILLCIVMYELDSRQLLRLNKENDGEDANIGLIPSITSTLLTIQYILLGFGIILVGIIFGYGIFYV